MRKRINITLDDSLYKDLKRKARRERVTISGIIETSLRKTGGGEKASALLSLLDSLPVPRINVAGDLKKLYYESKS